MRQRRDARRFGPTLGEQLERDRLRVRERQLERVLASLRRLERATDGRRTALRTAITDFRDELDQVRRGLRARGRPAPDRESS